MLPVFRTLGLRYLLRHWDRSILIVASIALGVATLVSTQVMLGCLDELSKESRTPVGGSADLYVTNGDSGVRFEVLDDLRKIPGVQSAQPLVFDRVTIVLPDGEPQLAVFFGADVDFERPGTVTDLYQEYQISITWALEREDMIRNPFRYAFLPWVVLSRQLADRIDASGGNWQDPLEVRLAGRTRNVLPVGIVDLRGESSKLGKYVIGTEVKRAASLNNAPGRASRIDVFYDPNADPTTVSEAVRDVVGTRAMVRDRDTQGQSTEEVIGGIKAGFNICAAGAMVVGLFLVYNALSVSVAERRRDIGIIRALGSTRLQVAGLFTIEAIVLGLLGGVLGIPLGSTLAYGALELLEEDLRSIFLTGNIPTVIPDTRLIVGALVAGLITSMGAALVPAIRAASDEPAEAARSAPSQKTALVRRMQWILCLSLTLGGVAMIVFRDALPPRVGSYFGLVLILVGLLLSMPLLVGLSAVILRPLTRMIPGVSLRLATENVTRASGRTGVVIGAFGAGVALMVQIATVGRSNEEPVMVWLDRVVKAELYLFAGDLASASASSSPMRPEVGNNLREAVPAVEDVVALRYSRLEFANTIVYLIAIDTQVYATATAARQDPQDPVLDVFPQLLEPNAVLVSQNFAAKYDVRVGDTISLPGPDGPVRLHVKGAVPDYTWNQGSVIIDRGQYIKLFQDDLVDFYHVYVEPGASVEAVRADVEEFASERALMVASRTETRDYVSGLINRIYQLAYLQEVIIGVVASLGIVMAVLISVLQRRRELGLFRAVGATRSQVVRSVLAEAAVMGILGTLLGVLMGIPLAWYILHVVLYEESGFVFEVLVPWGEILGIAFGALMVASVAGMLPARLAMRLEITEAIAYE